MRKLLVITLVVSLFAVTLPGAALAGDRNGSGNLLAGVAIGAMVGVIGGALLGAFSAHEAAPPVAYGPPVAYAPPPPVVYAPPPPVVYAPAPAVVYVPAPPVVRSAPPPIYRQAPVVVSRHWEPRDRMPRGYREHRGGWDRY
jgi:hypothetical protein